jgi:hypothetical protein
MNIDESMKQKLNLKKKKITQKIKNLQINIRKIK